MIDLKNFSLGKVKVTIDRYTGTYVNGVFTRSTSTTITTWASVQPYQTIEDEVLFDPNAGEYTDEIRLMYTTEKVYMNDRDTAGNPVTDIVNVEGDKWKPVKVEPWIHLNMEHYLVLLQKWDGN